MKPPTRGQFVVRPGNGGDFIRRGGGIIDLRQEPTPGVPYVVSADTASGRSADWSVGDVMDLNSGQIMASIRCKIPVQDFADQLKLLARWYNNAILIPERTGIGEALVSSLRNDANGLRAYGNIYQHVRPTDIARNISGDYGFPMTIGTRGTILEGLRRWVQDKRFPFLSEGHVDELGTFIYRETGTSPRAMEGCHDDRVISLALCVHVFGLRGQTPEKPMRKTKWKQKAYQPPPTRSFSY